MPYFTHLRKKSSFAVVETNGKLYIDGQGYSPDTLKPISGAEFDVFSPTPNSVSFFDFGSPVICLSRSSYICKTSQLSNVDSGKVKVFDSSLFLTGQSIGSLGFSSSGGNFLSTKNDPTGTAQRNDKLVSLSANLDYFQAKSPISIQTGTEDKGYRLNTVFWNQATGSSKVFASNSEALIRGNTTSNNVAVFGSTDLSTYQVLQSDKLEVNQLVYLDADKTNSASNYAVVNRSQIASSSTKTPRTAMYDTINGTRYVPIVELVDSGASSYWISVFGDLTGSTTAATHAASALAIAPSGEIYASSNVCLYKLSGSGSLIWQKNFAGSAASMAVDSLNQLICVHSVPYMSQQTAAVSAFSPSGSVLWSKSSEIESSASGLDTVIDSQNYSHSIGYMASGGSKWAYIYKRDSSGNLVWSYSRATANGIALDSSGNVWTAGTSVRNSGTGYSVMWLQKVSPSGTSLLSGDYNIDAGGQHSWDCIGIDSSDNIYVGGKQANSTLCVARYNTSGVLQWLRTGDSANGTSDAKIVIDKNNNMYIAYVYANTKTRLIKFNSSGNIVWSTEVSASGDQARLAKIKCDSFGNLYLLMRVNFVLNDKYVTCLMKVPPDGSGTGTYTFARGTLTYATVSSSWSAATITSSIGTGNSSLYLSEAVSSVSISDSSYPITKQAVGATYDPAPDSYVGCFASNAIWATFNEGTGPIYFTGNCPYPSTLGLDFVRVRYITQSAPTVKRVWATISNPSNLSQAIPSDINYRNVRPFLFKTDSGALMLGVFAYYNGASSASNVAALMVFSVGSTALADSITLTYLQRIDLSDGGTGFITSVTPVDDTQRAWVVNYGDKAKVYTWSQASNFTLTNTYGWGRSGQVDSYGIDSRGRLWYTTGDVLSYIPLKTDPTTANTSVKAFFDQSAYTYTGAPISSNLYISAYALDGGREQRSVTIAVDGLVVKFADGTISKTVTTSASGELALPVTVSGIGILQAKLS